MTYTVKKLAELSGISVRTLHFYDEVGLLKPAYYGENNYRYYEEEQLLLLQQILFFREMGFKLNDIQRIMTSTDFDKINALKSHRIILEKNLNQTKNMIETIDKTIAHIGGILKMRDEEFFIAIRNRSSEKQKSYEEYLIEKKIMNKEDLNKSWEVTKDWNNQDWEKFKNEGDKLNQALAEAINKHLSPSSPEVQNLIKMHYEMVSIFWTPTKESYTGLGLLYGEHPDYRKYYDQFHPELIEFLAEAMKIFSERNL